MNNKLLIFDGTSILAESYYKTLTSEVEALHSLRESGKTISIEEENEAYSTLLQAKKGIYINAIQGFFRILLDALDKTKPSHIIVTWGAERENNFRRKLFPGYKNDGKVKDRALIEQEKLTKSMLSNIGINQIQGFEYESLDLAGTIAEKFKNQMDIEIFARNSLSLQLTDIATVWYKTPNYENIIKRHSLDSYDYPKGTVKMDSKLLFEYKSLRPYQVPDFRALVGSSFSKIPGIKSVGQVTTTSLLEEYDVIENLYDDIDSCKTKNELVEFGHELTSCLMLPFNPLNFLIQGREDAFLGKQLATYKRDISNTDIDNLNEDILSVAKIDKVKILKELKNINLCPIKAKFTSKLNSIIYTMPFSALIVTYHPHIFSLKSNMFIKGVGSLEDSIPAELKIGDTVFIIIKLHDDTIVNFRDKISVDISNCEFYSLSEVQNRIREREKIQNERCISEITTAFSVSGHEDKSSSATLALDTSDESISSKAEVEIIETEAYYEEDCEVECDGSVLCVSIEGDNEEEVEESVTIVTSTTNNVNSNTHDTNNTGGLQLVESIIINKYYCRCCNNEFALLGSTASFCTSCGTKM